MAAATPEQAQAGMEAWQAWAQKAGSSIADHPHRHMPEAQIDVFEFLPIPGM